MELLNKLGRVASPGCVDFITRTVKDPEANQIIIKIRSSAICGSDLHIYKGKHPAVKLPVTIGHEFSGDVVAVGSAVTKVKIGDRVTVEPVIVCGKCEACRTGNYGYCENISFTYRNGDGAMANYITVLEPYVYHLPDTLSYNAGALIEPLSVAVHAVRRADVRMGEKVVVIGAGAIGILVAALCRKCGAAEVAVVDFNDGRLKKALEMGATSSINGKTQDVYEEVSRLTNGVGADKAFECVGLEATFNEAMTVLRKGGLATIIGIFENPQITINASRFITHEIRVQGAQGYCWDFPVSLRMSREINLEKIITHEFPMSDLQKALDVCLDKSSGALKVVLHP